MPHVIAYNASKPTKFTSFPNYEKFIADQKYAEIATAIGIEGKTDAEKIQKLIKEVRNLISDLGIPLTLKNSGVDEGSFKMQILDMAYIAFDDQCTGSNPRYPLVRELEDIYRLAYGE